MGRALSFGPGLAGAEAPEPPSRLGPTDGIPNAVHGLGLGKSNDWHTPKAVFDALGCRFDLDVAAPNDGPLHVPTSRWFSSGALEQDWFGFVWMNPPFGGRNALDPWLVKFFDHGSGIALTPDRTSAPWSHNAWRRADAVLFTRKTPFLLPTGARAGSPAFGTALWASGAQAVAALRNAASQGFGLLAVPAQGTSGFAQDRNGLDPKGAGPVPNGDAP